MGAKLNSNMKADLSERRQSQRHRLTEGPLAINPHILGPILDLSFHGMLFEYNGEDLDNGEIIELGIFDSESKMLLTGLRTRTIRDRILENNNSFLPIIRKIRAVEFLAPSGEQLQQIRQIIAEQGASS